MPYKDAELRKRKQREYGLKRRAAAAKASSPSGEPRAATVSPGVDPSEEMPRSAAPGDASGSPATGKSRPDPQPRVRRGAPRRSKRPSDEQLESMVRKVAVAPAIPAMLWLHCNYCAAHFQASAGPLAAELVEVSHDDKDLREILEWAYSSWRKYAWAGMLASWLGVPLLHHAAPTPIYNLAGPLMGMPPRAQHTHTHQQARPMPAATPDFHEEGIPAHEHGEVVDAELVVPPADLPFAQMLGGMNVGDLFAMAGGLGIELPADVLAAASTLAGNGAPAKTASVDEPERTLEEQERDLAATAAEAAAAQAAALNADPYTN